MIQDQNTGDNLINTLKQSIIEYVDNTNDQSTLARCLDILQAAC